MSDDCLLSQGCNLEDESPQHAWQDSTVDLDVKALRRRTCSPCLPFALSPLRRKPHLGMNKGRAIHLKWVKRLLSTYSLL